jgi:hypothetical protein
MDQQLVRRKLTLALGVLLALVYPVPAQMEQDIVNSSNVAGAPPVTIYQYPISPGLMQ